MRKFVLKGERRMRRRRRRRSRIVKGGEEKRVKRRTRRKRRRRKRRTSVRYKQIPGRPKNGLPVHQYSSNFWSFASN